MLQENSRLETATLAGGCFWCTEAIFKRLKGVISVTPGYSGGDVLFPTAEQVYSETTGHAESIQIEFDPQTISFEKILEIFWHTHNPTTLNQQDNDVGTEYRSAIFYHDEKQKEIALASKEAIEKSKLYPDPVVTQIEPFKNFYPAAESQKDYYENHRLAPYCIFITTPKIKKLLEKFKTDVKDEFK